MADFTMELREVIARNGETGIGLDRYPIFDEAYREYLNERIIDHYFYNEIGLESVDMWIRQMHTKMCEIMPYYNKLYRSEMIDIDPLSTQDTRSETGQKSAAISDSAGSQSADQRSVTDSTSDGTSRTVQSQMPQARLAGNKDYATAATDVASRQGGTNKVTGDSKSDSSSHATNSSETSQTSHSWGYTGHTAALIAAWRQTFINIDLMVITELQELFMGVRSSNDSITGRGEYYPYTVYSRVY